jgi:hypothetical protein
MTTLDIAHRRLFSRAVPTNICTFLRELSSRPRTPRILLEELRSLSERPMIIRMTTTSRPQQCDDHRLRDLVQRTGDLTITTDLGVRARRREGGCARGRRWWSVWRWGTSRSTNSGRRS